MCIQCYDVGPPPDQILTLPPPPLPAFLLPKTALVALAHNDSQPCYAAYMCESNLGLRDQSGIEFIELPGQNDAWIFLIIALLIGIILLIIVLTFMIMKCREDNTRKHTPPKSMCHEPHVSMEKSQSFMPGNILYPCPSNDQSLTQELNKENRLLWATLTPHGTRHVIASGSEQPYTNYEDHYEVVDYHNKPTVKTRETRLHEPLKKFPNKSFDNNGFSDFDYEDMHLTNAAEFYHDENDSGYQEPHEVIATLNRNNPNFNPSRFVVSTPTPIENHKIPPLNAYPHRAHNSGTINKKATLSRRTNEMLNYYGQGSNI